MRQLLRASLRRFASALFQLILNLTYDLPVRDLPVRDRSALEGRDAPIDEDMPDLPEEAPPLPIPRRRKDEEEERRPKR